MRMFDIQEGLRQVLDAMAQEMEQEGFISDETMRSYEELAEAKENKKEAIALYYKEALAEAEAIKAEAGKLAERAKVAANKADSLKNYLTMILANEEGDAKDGFETARVKVSFRKSDSVVIDDFKLIDEKFIVRKTTEDPDKTAIKKAIKAGEVIEGAHLETKQNIQIK